MFPISLPVEAAVELEYGILLEHCSTRFGELHLQGISKKKKRRFNRTYIVSLIVIVPDCIAERKHSLYGVTYGICPHLSSIESSGRTLRFGSSFQSFSSNPGAATTGSLGIAVLELALVRVRGGCLGDSGILRVIT